MTKTKIIFEEGCFDQIDDLTEEEMDQLLIDIIDAVESGEFFEDATPVEELPAEDQEEIMRMLSQKKNTRH
jgi:ClpP class serine protease